MKQILLTLIDRLFPAKCKHEWEDKYMVSVKNEIGQVYKTRVTLACKHCGEIKQMSL
jgi:hypothetical protein